MSFVILRIFGEEIHFECRNSGLREILNRNIGVYRGETLFVASQFRVRGIKQFSRKLLHSGGHTVNTVTGANEFQSGEKGGKGVTSKLWCF